MKTHAPKTSSSVHRIDHDGTTLTVHYKSGGVYHYHDVPEATFDAIAAAPSVGKALHAHVLSQGLKFTKAAQ